MSFTAKVVLGLILGFIFGWFSISNAISSKQDELNKAWLGLFEALNIRYLKLINVLKFLSNHMGEFQNEINSLIDMLNTALEADNSIQNVQQRLAAENNINYKLEEIKVNMSNYPSLSSDPEVNSSIQAIQASENNVGNAITYYNAKALEYRVFIETFPISLVASFSPKPYLGFPFDVTQAEEFDDSYVDEDEI